MRTGWWKALWYCCARHLWSRIEGGARGWVKQDNESGQQPRRARTCNVKRLGSLHRHERGSARLDSCHVMDCAESCEAALLKKVGTFDDPRWICFLGMVDRYHMLGATNTARVSNNPVSCRVDTEPDAPGQHIASTRTRRRRAVQSENKSCCALTFGEDRNCAIPNSVYV